MTDEQIAALQDENENLKQENADLKEQVEVAEKLNQELQIKLTAALSNPDEKRKYPSVKIKGKKYFVMHGIERNKKIITAEAIAEDKELLNELLESKSSALQEYS